MPRPAMAALALACARREAVLCCAVRRQHPPLHLLCTLVRAVASCMRGGGRGRGHACHAAACMLRRHANRTMAA